MPWRSAYSAIHFNSAIPPTSSGSGPITLTAWVLDQLHEVLPQVDLLSGVNGSRRAVGHLLEDLGVRVRLVVAGDQVFEPGEVIGFHGAGKADGIL
jgi:hypothetical protein